MMPRLSSNSFKLHLVNAGIIDVYPLVLYVCVFVFCHAWQVLYH